VQIDIATTDFNSYYKGVITRHQATTSRYL